MDSSEQSIQLPSIRFLLNTVDEGNRPDNGPLQGPWSDVRKTERREYQRHRHSRSNPFPVMQHGTFSSPPPPQLPQVQQSNHHFSPIPMTLPSLPPDLSRLSLSSNNGRYDPTPPYNGLAIDIPQRGSTSYAENASSLPASVSSPHSVSSATSVGSGPITPYGKMSPGNAGFPRSWSMSSETKNNLDIPGYDYRYGPGHRRNVASHHRSLSDLTHPYASPNLSLPQPPHPSIPSHPQRMLGPGEMASSHRRAQSVTNVDNVHDDSIVSDESHRSKPPDYSDGLSTSPSRSVKTTRPVYPQTTSFRVPAAPSAPVRHIPIMPAPAHAPTTQHTTQPPRYACPHCSKTFSRPSSLKIHVYSHTGEKPFVCEVDGCGRRFSVQSNMRRHMKVHRNEVDTKKPLRESTMQEASEEDEDAEDGEEEDEEQPQGDNMEVDDDEEGSEAESKSRSRSGTI